MGKRGLPRASCEECRRKKARCDLLDRRALGGTSCSPCSSKSLPCRLLLEREASHATSSSPQQPASTTTTTDSPAPPSALPDELYLPGSRQLSRSASIVASVDSGSGKGSSSQGVVGQISTPSSSSRKHVAGLLDVPGLSYLLLQESVDAYFATAGHLNPSLDSNDFRRRLRAYISPLFTSAPTEDEAGDISPLLILAVAAVGIAQTAQPARFDLQRSIVSRAAQLASEGMVQHGLDGLVAALILDDIVTGADGSPLFWAKQDDPLRIHPLSHEGVVRLARHFELHREASPSDRSGRLFWHIYAVNCWRYGLPGYLHPREIDIERPPTLGAWQDSLVSLGEVNHEMYEMCWTGPFRRKGISPEQVIALLKRLHEYETAHGLSASPTEQQQQHQQHHGPPGDGELASASRSGLLRMLYLNTIMSLEAYVRVVGLQTGSADVEEVRTMLRTNVTRAFGEIVELVQEATRRGYFHFQARAFRTLAVGCLQWCIERITRAHEHGRESAADWLLGCGDKLMAAIESTSRCYVDTPPLAVQLRTQLQAVAGPQQPGGPLDVAATTPFQGDHDHEFWRWLLDADFYGQQPT